MAEIIERAGTVEVVRRHGVGRLLDRVATLFTMLGGLTFCALIAMGISLRQKKVLELSS